MEMDEVIEVIGLAPLLRRNPLTGGPSPWLPHSNTPQELELRLRYKGYEFHAYLAGTREGAERLGLFREGSWLGGWAVKVVNVEGEPNPRGGGQTVDAVPTLEAAIVSALSSVYVLDHTREERERALRARGASVIGAPVRRAAEPDDVVWRYEVNTHDHRRFDIDLYHDERGYAWSIRQDPDHEIVGREQRHSTRWQALGAAIAHLREDGIQGLPSIPGS